jgi:hypothetical protein
MRFVLWNVMSLFRADSLMTVSRELSKYKLDLVRVQEVRPPLWYSGQSSWLQIRRPGFDSRHYEKKKVVGSGTGSTQPREYN